MPFIILERMSDLMKLYLDPGHGGTDSGAAANGLLEKNLNLDIALRIRDKLLSNYSNIDIRMSRTTDKTLSLKQRTDDANKWGANYFLSIHINAGGGVGYEDFIHDKLSNSSETAKIQGVIHKEITKLVDFTNRGQKKANFHVLRESNMPALLTENGFIDNASDAAKLKDSAYLNKIATGHANGIAIAFNLTPKKTTAAKPSPAPSSKRVKIYTGGLNNEKVLLALDYMREKNWNGMITIEWEKGNPKLTTGNLTEAKQKVFEAWLKEKNWWYEVIEVK